MNSHDSQIGRRDFFRFGVSKAVDMASQVTAAKIAMTATPWIRPPFALAEPLFLDACTSCGKCAEACTYGVLFDLPASVGGKAVGTPAMDLLKRGCHLCEDWPCVSVCEPGALKQVDPDEDDEEPRPLPPKFARVSIDTDTCLPYAGPECGACAYACPVPGALNWDGPKPSIDQDACTGCALCREACITEPNAIKVASMS